MLSPDQPARELEFWRAGRLGKRGPRGRPAPPRIIFGQVREDAGTELALFAETPAPRRAFVIASGGCTALALLAAAGADGAVCAVDINPAQTALLELKAAALDALTGEETAPAFERDARPVYPRLRLRLTESTRTFFDGNTAGLLRRFVQVYRLE